MKRQIILLVLCFGLVGIIGIYFYQQTQIIRKENERLERIINYQESIVDYLKTKTSPSSDTQAKRIKFAQYSFDTYQCDLRKVNLQFYWKNQQGQFFKSLGNLQQHLYKQEQTLLFATNAGMFKANRYPVGLYVENKQEINALNLGQKRGNFFLKPNGVFLITTNNEAQVVESTQYPKVDAKIKFATQSGPMLLLNGKIHPKFGKNSPNRNIRSGVGVLGKNKVIFAISNQEVTFYEFAAFFKKLGCQNALYLDGHISQMYLPSLKRYDDGGNFGVMIGVSEKRQ